MNNYKYTWRSYMLVTIQSMSKHVSIWNVFLIVEKYLYMTIYVVLYAL
jgi:hypothetical protein